MHTKNAHVEEAAEREERRKEEAGAHAIRTTSRLFRLLAVVLGLALIHAPDACVRAHCVCYEELVRRWRRTHTRSHGCNFAYV